MSKILITPRSLTADGHPALNRLTEAGFELVFGPSGQQPNEAQLLSLVRDCVGYLAGAETVSATVLESASNLRVISRNGVGINAIDVEAAQRLGIAIATTPGANAQGVAELAVGMMFALARTIPEADRTLKSGKWSRSRGVELAGRTLGVVGCGSVGERTARLAACIGMRILGFDVRAIPVVKCEGFAWASLEKIVETADVITLHRPPADRPVIDASILRQMRTGACLVNTARAELVDDEAVLASLESGKLAGYATDVYREEPPVDRRLVDHPRVIATGHIGGYTNESVERATEGAVANLLTVLSAP